MSESCLKDESANMSYPLNVNEMYTGNCKKATLLLDKAIIENIISSKFMCTYIIYTE